MAAAGPGADSGESHRDLVLATLAELGLPLETKLRGAEREYALADAFSDSIATFICGKKSSLGRPSQSASTDRR